MKCFCVPGQCGSNQLLIGELGMNKTILAGDRSGKLIWLNRRQNYEYTSLPWAEGLVTSSAKLSNFICICEHFPQTKYDILLPKHRQMEI